MVEIVLALNHLHGAVRAIDCDAKSANCHLILPVDFGLFKLALDHEDSCSFFLGTVVNPDVIGISGILLELCGEVLVIQNVVILLVRNISGSLSLVSMAVPRADLVIPWLNSP
jgi:hypothetical protein